jgi:Uma2 family endonuclease
MNPRPGAGRVSEAEYLAFEDSQPTKHELVNGEIVAMSGAIEAHNRLEINLLGLMISGLRGGPCRPNTSNFRVKIDETGMYAYPDLSIVCGQAELTSTRPPSLTNPTAIVEVLSESTANYDLGAKAAHYRHRSSVRTILFVDSRSRWVQLQERNADGSWTLTDVNDGEVQLLGVRLRLDDIYADVDLDAA